MSEAKKDQQGSAKTVMKADRIVINQTAQRIGVAGKDQSTDDMFVLPPFGRLPITTELEGQFNFELWQHRQLIEIKDAPRPGKRVNRRSEILRRAAFAAALVIAVALPAALIFWIPADWLGDGTDGLPRFLKAAQFALIAVFASLPPLLYFGRDREKLETLREQFLRDVLKLDASLATIAEARALHWGRIGEAFGRPSDDECEVEGEMKCTGEARWPVMAATLIITLGWVLTLLPDGVGAGGQEAEAQSLVSSLTQGNHAVNFGFMGAYFFSLNMLLRRYLRADLRPKAYTHAAVRIVTVIVLAWFLGVIPGLKDDLLLLPLAFVVGIVPETAFAIFSEFVRGRKWLKPHLESLQERQPLTELQGINLYDKARLFEEGIENVQNLVHQELTETMLNTRIPASRLVDWIDQGILSLHLGKDTHADASRNNVEVYDRRVLSECGILTATDLILAHKRAKKRDEEAGRNLEDGETGKLMGVLGTKRDVKRLQVILDALSDDELLEEVTNWRWLTGPQLPVLSPQQFDKQRMRRSYWKD